MISSVRSRRRTTIRRRSSRRASRSCTGRSPTCSRVRGSSRSTPTASSTRTRRRRCSRSRATRRRGPSSRCCRRATASATACCARRASSSRRGAMANPYETLGVAKNATQDEIKKAYRKLVREVHPDRNPGMEERFKEVQNAYDVLSDPEKRKQYDAFGSANGRMPGGGAGPGATTFDFGDFDLGDIFGGLFGGRAGQQQPQRGQRGNDVEVEVNISFEDALKGVKTTVPVQLELACHTCHGTGAAPGTAPVKCP